MACGRLEGLPGKKEKNMAAQFIFAKLHLNRLQDFWNNVLFSHNAQYHIHLTPTVKQGCGRAMI